MHQLVLDLRKESGENEDFTLALVLVQESATNIVLAFNRAKAVAKGAVFETTGIPQGMTENSPAIDRRALRPYSDWLVPQGPPHWDSSKDGCVGCDPPYGITIFGSPPSLLSG